MEEIDILWQRLNNQQIAAHTFKDASELVAWMGAVQAQDFAAAKWALSLRLQRATDNDIETAFNKGEILRTHVMRPTWHFVAPQDIRWLLKLTAPRVLTTITNSGRKLGLDEPIFRRSNKLIVKALHGGNYLIRTQIETILNKAGIVTDDLHMIHLMMRAELDGLICSGPRKGKQFTYALLDERAPQTKMLEKDEALVELTERYFQSHGPATVQDFVWWSGLTVTDAKEGLEMVKSKMIHETVDGKAYWFSGPVTSFEKKEAGVFLLPNFDEYTVAYKDRSLLIDPAKVKIAPGPFILLGNTVIIDGRVAGAWKRTIKKDKIELIVNELYNLSKAKKQVIVAEAKRYGRFINMPITIQ